jgi:hypothetical protein
VLRVAQADSVTAGYARSGVSPELGLVRGWCWFVVGGQRCAARGCPGIPAAVPGEGDGAGVEAAGIPGEWRWRSPGRECLSACSLGVIMWGGHVRVVVVTQRSKERRPL